MGDQFLPGLESFKQPFSTAQSDPNIGLFTNHFPGINPGHHQNNIHALTGFPLDRNPFPDSPGLFIQDNNSPVHVPVPVSPVNDQIFKNQADKKRKAMEISTPGNSPANSSPQGSDSGNNARRKGLGRGKKAKGNEMEEKPREVVHVRAKRGQATDSHSLAERVRREKINERLRCLQDIVPGCYKTMGMAVMLDEIINYVQSLQNQVEFLSMKLTAASTFYDFNSEADALEAMQRAKAFQAIKFQNGASHGLTPSQLASMCLNSGTYPQWPQDR